ncbi:MAG TPA: alpha/beta fold hydrolase [Gemmatimonadales bacterium]|nr:alpha/beta fold hydrolase [Gemmatimonadales bacterium]
MKAALALLILPAALAAQTPQLVNIGTHRLEVVRAGTGSPTIVFEAGLGDTWQDWDSVWHRAADLSSAIVYSRSGLGNSEPGPGDHSARTEMAELHRLLDSLHIPRPIVLVARSYGGLLSRLYVSMYPHDVAGLVLVDGTHEQQVKRWGQIDPKYPEQFRAYFDSVMKTMKPGAERDETRETVRIQAAGTVDGLEPLPDIPLAVLTSMRPSPKPAYVNMTAGGHEAWRAMHEEWAQRSRYAEHIVTVQAGHAIQDDQPLLVIDAIRFVLGRVRAGAVTATGSAGLADSIRIFMARVARDVTHDGPLAWHREFSTDSTFFMAADGRLAFASGAEAARLIDSIPNFIAQITLTWGDAIRVDSLAPGLAVVGADYHEVQVDPAGHVVDDRGYFTGVVQREAAGWKFRNAHWSVRAP